MIHSARCERLLPGEGSIDVGGLFGALPPDVPVSVEIVNFAREAGGTPRDWAATCMDASRNLLERQSP